MKIVKIIAALLLTMSLTILPASAKTVKLTKKQLKNRQFLRDVMIKHGFKPISTEWWHFTLKDEPYPDTYFTFTSKDLKSKTY